jgi:hypothetical protein
MVVCVRVGALSASAQDRLHVRGDLQFVQRTPPQCVRTLHRTPVSYLSALGSTQIRSILVFALQGLQMILVTLLRWNLEW